MDDEAAIGDAITLHQGSHFLRLSAEGPATLECVSVNRDRIGPCSALERCENCDHSPTVYAPGQQVFIAHGVEHWTDGGQVLALVPRMCLLAAQEGDQDPFGPEGWIEEVRGAYGPGLYLVVAETTEDGVHIGTVLAVQD